MNVKKIGIEAAIVGALAFSAVGFGGAVANADQSVPNSPGMTWKLDEGDDWDGWSDGEWDGPRWVDPAFIGGCVWVPPAVALWVPPAVC